MTSPKLFKVVFLDKEGKVLATWEKTRRITKYGGAEFRKSERVSAVTIHQILEGLSQVKEFRSERPISARKLSVTFVRRRWENLILINYTDAATYEFPADDWTPRHAGLSWDYPDG
jgi:hypothetical protein